MTSDKEYFFPLKNRYFLQRVDKDCIEIQSFFFSIIAHKICLSFSCFWNDLTGVVMDDNNTNFVKLRVTPYHKRYQMHLVS